VDRFSSLIIYIYTHGLWILGHKLGFYWVSKILVEKQFMNVRHSILMKKLRSSTCCEKCYTFWTLHWKLKNQILLCFKAQDKQFMSLQKKTWMKCANKINFSDLFDFIMNKTLNFSKAQHNWNKKNWKEGIKHLNPKDPKVWWQLTFASSRFCQPNHMCEQAFRWFRCMN
jgi:hypothetical protein